MNAKKNKEEGYHFISSAHLDIQLYSLKSLLKNVYKTFSKWKLTYH